MYSNLVSGELVSVEGVEVFNGFPYLMTYIVRSFYHLTFLPATWCRHFLFKLAKLQAAQNKLDTFLVLNEMTFIYFPGRNSNNHRFLKKPPAWGKLVSDRLQPVYPIPEDLDLKARNDKWQKIEEDLIDDDFIFGDPTKGGRQATPKDLEQLKGFNEDGVPTGLYKCNQCGFYKGTCLDPSPCFQGLKVKVHCRCENDNKCARCGQPLSQFRLNANYYDEKTRSIWYVPGFTALNHVCPDLSKKRIIQRIIKKREVKDED